LNVVPGNPGWQGRIHRARETAATRHGEAREEHEEIATAGIVFQEVPPGIRSDSEYDYMRQALRATLILQPQ
jgi:hypothetical protein